MDYKEITINTPAELIEQRCDELTELGISGFVVENEDDFKSFLENNKRYWDYVDDELERKFKNLSRIKIWLEADDINTLSVIQNTYHDIAIRDVSDSDWENNWREFYKPIVIGNKTIVVPQWEENPDESRIPLILDPGLIFGTGSHATTRMCLEAIEDYAGAGKRVLDLGCGSGILGIGALNLGCDSCVGVDIDPKAPDIVISNASLNPNACGKLRAYAGDILSDNSLCDFLGTGYNLVLANIVADVIIPLSAKVRKFMADNAVFICSGIIDGREKEVISALRSNGFDIIKSYHIEEWNAFVCK